MGGKGESESVAAAAQAAANRKALAERAAQKAREAAKSQTPPPPPHYVVSRSHAVARGIADALAGNAELRHLELSSCQLDEIDTTVRDL